MMQNNSKEDGEDFYWEGSVLVFTAGYHLRRGYCCQQGCRHCPYRETGAGQAALGLAEGPETESSESL
ncbi:MAG: DUF5522 domain-containing protein [Verrucomicrobiia bacterium]